MLLAYAIVSALLNLLFLAALPLLIYYVFHRWRHERSFPEVARRAGLQVGETRYLAYCLAVGAAVSVILILWPPSLQSSLGEGSAFRSFGGLGLSTTSVLMAFVYGVIKTGFVEELLFRGLIAGSLSRRLSLLWANLIQAIIFLVPHLFVLTVAPRMWPILPVIFAGALFAGWVRIRSGSMVGPWIIHAFANVTMGLSVAIRSVS